MVYYHFGVAQISLGGVLGGEMPYLKHAQTVP